MNADGKMGVGGSPSSANYQLRVEGSAYATGSFINSSSRALKQEISELPLSEALKAVKALKPVTYQYKANPDEDEVGFIAEDVPQLVATNNRKGLSALDITAVLTKVVQHLQTENETLKKRLDALESREP